MASHSALCLLVISAQLPSCDSTRPHQANKGHHQKKSGLEPELTGVPDEMPSVDLPSSDSFTVEEQKKEKGELEPELEDVPHEVPSVDMPSFDSLTGEEQTEKGELEPELEDAHNEVPSVAVPSFISLEGEEQKEKGGLEPELEDDVPDEVPEQSHESGPGAATMKSVARVNSNASVSETAAPDIEEAPTHGNAPRTKFHRKSQDVMGSTEEEMPDVTSSDNKELSNEDVHEWQSAFDTLDPDENGHVTASSYIKYQAGPLSLGKWEEELAQHIAQFADDGLLNIKAFEKVKEYEQQHQEEFTNAMFKALDKDSDGFIHVDDLVQWTVADAGQHNLDLDDELQGKFKSRYKAFAGPDERIDLDAFAKTGVAAAVLGLKTSTVKEF